MDFEQSYFIDAGFIPKLSLSCSRNIKVKIVCGPSLTKAGMKPLKKACGPCLAVNVTKPRAPLNSPKEKKSNMSTLINIS